MEWPHLYSGLKYTHTLDKREREREREGETEGERERDRQKEIEKEGRRMSEYNLRECFWIILHSVINVEFSQNFNW